MPVRPALRRALVVITSAALIGGAAVVGPPAASAALGTSVDAAGRAATPAAAKASLPSRIEVRGAPVVPTPRTLRQPDGTRITVAARGDAMRHWLATPAGDSVARDAKGWYRFATSRDARGQLRADGGVVGRAKAPTASRHLTPSQNTATTTTQGGSAAPRRTPTTPKPMAPMTGTQRTLVLLVQFADQASLGSTPSEWQQSFFGPTLSVRDFYQKASFNALDLQPAAETQGTANDGVVGWLTLNRLHPNTGDAVDYRNQQLTADALAAADPFVDYAAFDTNHDGAISSNELHLTVIVAGYEKAYVTAPDTCGPGGPSVWGHQWAVGSPDQDSPGTAPTVGTLDGVQVGGSGYTQFGEWHCDPNDAIADIPIPSHRATIGIMAHEMGHDLGWPDLYDYDTAGIGDWSLMSMGSWTYLKGSTEFVGSRPTLPDAWSKYAQGWITPTAVQGTVNAAIPAADAHPSAFLLGTNPLGVDWAFDAPGTGEYYLVENRRDTVSEYDQGLPGCGLMIYHIDESQPDNFLNLADPADHRLVSVVQNSENPTPQNGEPTTFDQPDYTGSEFDPWGTAVSTRDRFAWFTDPSSVKYDKGDSGVDITVTSPSCADTMTASLTYTPVTGATGTFHPVTPTRILDTRVSPGVKVRNGATVDVAVAGKAGIPTSGVAAAVLNVTAVQPTRSGWVTVYPTGSAVPNASNLNPTAGTPAVAGLTVVRVGTGGKVSLQSQTGDVHFVVDVVGWYAAWNGSKGQRFTAVTPQRRLNTQTGAKIGPNGRRDVLVTGNGIPSTATGVVLNLTATQPTANTWLRVWPTGQNIPNASNLNVVKGQTLANLVYSPIGAGGKVTVHNAAGSVHGVVDVVGWFGPTGKFYYHPIEPTRVVDSRIELAMPGQISQNHTIALSLARGYEPVPSVAAALVANVTATNTTAFSWLTIWPGNVATRPDSSNLNWTARQTVPNLVSTMTGPQGSLNLWNAKGSADLIVDIAGWYGLY